VPREASLDAVYGRGPEFGGRVDFGILDFGELWLGLDYFGKSAADAAAGGTRRLRLVPIEAGVKFLMTRGLLNPYIGFGAVYFLYREESPSGAERRGAFGVTATAGVFLRISRFLVLDAHVRYRRLPVDAAVPSFDAGGFHFGGGAGIEF
jgi:hypothetical protein